jgi:hypothetical protein
MLIFFLILKRFTGGKQLRSITILIDFLSPFRLRYKDFHGCLFTKPGIYIMPGFVLYIAKASSQRLNVLMNKMSQLLMGFFYFLVAVSQFFRIKEIKERICSQAQANGFQRYYFIIGYIAKVHILAQ